MSARLRPMIEKKTWLGHYKEDGWTATLFAIDSTCKRGEAPVVRETWQWSPPAQADGGGRGPPDGAAAPVGACAAVAAAKARGKAKAKAKAKA